MVTIHGLRAGWTVLNDLLGELRAKDVFIPDLTYADLRNSKMVIEYLSSFENDIKVTDHADERLRLEMETKILSLRETLLVWAEERAGVEYRQNWEERFQRAIEGLTPVKDTERTPITDIPREKDVSFFRIRLPEDIPVEVVSEVAEDCGVLISLDGDRHLQVSGKKDCVRDAMQRLGEMFYGKSKLTKKDSSS
ncbi:MAG: DUF2096 family protein [Candidatus Thorarchaeota archaeon]|jgi:hypothetical protein